MPYRLRTESAYGICVTEFVDAKAAAAALKSSVWLDDLNDDDFPIRISVDLIPANEVN